VATTDFLSALGAGVPFSTKELITSLVDAERAPAEARIQRKIDDSNAKISAFGTAVAELTKLQDAAKTLNDSTDFDAFLVTNSQSTAFTAVAGAGAQPGTHSINVSNVARPQTTNVTQSGSAVFTSKTQALNSGASFGITIQVGGGSGVSHAITVSTATPQGIADAINAADIGVSAGLIDTGTSGVSYVIQLTGQTGASSAFTISEDSTSILSQNTPSGFSAADASLTVNGLSFTRSSNEITDVLEGVTLNLNSATSSAASLSLNRDSSAVRQNLEAFVDTYNTTKSALDTLTDYETEGALRGDSVVRSTIREVRGVMTNISSTPGASLTRLSDIGISITRTGTFEINDEKLDAGLTSNFSDIKTLFSADTNQQSEVGTASRGIAGDLSKLITDLSSSTGYFTTKQEDLKTAIAGYNENISDLDEKMERLKERYDQQFLSMQKVINEMNSTRDDLISSFENLPFTNRD
jgi:flagellar hook-associated protein 2